MLSTTSILNGMELANAAIVRGRRFSVVEGSALEILLATMQPVNLAEAEEADLGELVGRNAKPLNNAFDPHTSEMRTISTGVSNRLAANIRLARGPVNALIRACIEAATDAKREIDETSPLNINLIHVSPLAIFNSSKLQEQIERYRVGDYRELKLSERLRRDLRANLTDEVILDGLKNGNDLYNNTLTDLMNTINKQGMAATDYILNTPEWASANPNMMQDPTAVLNFIFLGAVLAGQVSTFDLNHIDLDERNELILAQAFYGNRAGRQLTAIRNFASQENFLFLSGHGTRTYHVYDRNFRLWLENGGSAEALIACLASGRSVPEVAKLLKENPTFWANRYTQVANQRKMESRIVSTKRLEAVISSRIVEYLQTEMDEAMRPELFQNLKKQLQLNPLQTNTDLVQYTRRLVCESLFQATSAYQLLSDIESYMEIHKDATISKAAVVASARSIGRWLATQIVVTEAPLDNKVVEPL